MRFNIKFNIYKGLEKYKYEFSKIYKITNEDNNNVYIGSTIGILKNRLSHHVSEYKKYINNLSNIYCYSFEIIKYSSYKIILLEEYKCNNKIELMKRERWYQENTNNCINKNKAYMTENERKKYMNNYNKLYIQKKITICECGAIIKKWNKNNHIKTTSHYIHLNLFHL